MARPTKQGLEYFSLDVDFFTDIKVRKIARACGASSSSILICLLCNIYKENGYYILWDEDLPFVIADTVGVAEGAVKEVIIKSIQVGFFDKGMYEKYNILTSSSIQKRFFAATYQRKDVSVNCDFILIEMSKNVFHANNPVIHANNSINCMRSTQSKVKESKVYNIVEKRAHTRGDDYDAFLKQFFFPDKQQQIESLCMNLRMSEYELRNTAMEVVNEWKLSETTHESYSDAARHLISQIRIKSRLKEQKANTQSHGNYKQQERNSTLQGYEGTFALFATAEE